MNPEQSLNNEGQLVLSDDSLTDQMYGLVKGTFTDEELDELYAQQ